MLELPSDGSPNPRSQTSPGSTLPFGSAEYCDFRHRCTRLEIEESMHRTVELECFMYLLWSGLFGSLSSSPLRSGRWRGSFAPCGSQTAGCRSRGSKVFLAERHRSDIQHLVLCRSSQRCSERRTQPIIVHLDVLQLSGRLAGDVKESPNGNPTRDLQMAADRIRPHTLCCPVVSSLFSVAARC